MQIIDLLFSTFENAIQKTKELEDANIELEAMQHQLTTLNEELEGLVEKRTRKVTHLNAVLRAIRKINQLITQEKDAQKLIDQSCAILTKSRGYSGSWIALLDESGTVHTAAESSIGKDFSLIIERMKRGELPACVRNLQGKSGVVMFTPEKVLCRGCPLLKNHIDHQVMMIRLEHAGKYFGIMNTYISKDFALDKEEKDLFAELSEDIVFALHSIESQKLHDQMELQLIESEKLLQKTFEGIRDAIFIIEADSGKIIDCNPAACEIFGFSRKDMLGRSSDFLYAGEEDLEKFKARLDSEIKDKGFLFLAGLEMKFKDGTVFPTEHSVVPLEDDAGRISAWVHLIRDTTERNRAEEEKKKMQMQLQQAQKMEAIGTLAGGIAHDFNNLLTAIRGYTELALMSIDEATPLSRDLKEVEKAAGRAANLTRQLLLFSRRQPMELLPVNINEVIDNLLKMLNRLIGENIEIKVEMEEDIRMVLADAGNIEQVIMNLAVNSRDAMPDGGSINIRTENINLDEKMSQMIPDARPGKFVSVSLSDTGTGIKPEVLSRIFDPFFSTKKVGEGTGLGLAVVYGIIKEHKGWIHVESFTGKGTMFRLFFPVFSEKKVEVKEDETQPHAEYRGLGERILLIEDEENVRRLASRVLGDNGYVVLETGSVKEGLALFKRENGDFRLVLSDMVLPDGNGIDLVEQLKREKPDLSVLLSSGYSDDKSRFEKIRSKGYQFLQKPYDLSGLLHAVKETIEGK